MTSLRITGATRLFAIVGDPIAQVRSPEVYAERFAAAGVDAVLVPAHVLPDAFDRAIPALMGLRNLDGLLVTAPYKARAARYADRLGATAARIGAVNALRREADDTWSGEMFDGAGFVNAILRKRGVLRGRRALLFGAGGAGSAIACALAEAGVASIAIVDPQRERAEALAAKLQVSFPACALSAVAARPADADLVVNASPVGMNTGDGLPGDVGTLTADTLIGDVVVSDAPTSLVELARRHRCTHVTGRDMVAGQVDAILRFFAPALSAATNAADAAPSRQRSA